MLVHILAFLLCSSQHEYFRFRTTRDSSAQTSTNPSNIVLDQLMQLPAADTVSVSFVWNSFDFRLVLVAEQRPGILLSSQVRIHFFPTKTITTPCRLFFSHFDVITRIEKFTAHLRVIATHWSYSKMFLKAYDLNGVTSLVATPHQP